MQNRTYIISLLMLILICSAPAFGEGTSNAHMKHAQSHWTVLGGYGTTHPGLGDTRTRVEMASLIVQYGHFLKDVGRSWYSSRHELLIEIPFHRVTVPERAMMTGINFLASWNFMALSETVVPYLTVGGGLVYTDLDIPDDIGSQFNGNYQAGLGLRYPVRTDIFLNMHYRLHHISNAGTASPNMPLNSSKFFVGVSFYQ